MKLVALTPTKIYLLGISLFLTVVSQGQIIHTSGQPDSWQLKNSHIQGAVHVLPRLNAAGKQATPAAGNGVKGPFKWGTPRTVKLDFVKSAQSIVRPNGDVKLMMKLSSPGAAMMSMHLSSFDLQPGSKLYLYDKGKTRYVGPLTDQNELPSGTMSTAVIPGDEVILELHLASGVQFSQDQVVIENIVHGLYDMFGFKAQYGTKDYSPGFDSQYCNVNVACPIAAPWQDQVSSVAMFLNNQGWGCNGTMLNNTAQDGTPYFQIANHCLLSNTAAWVFYWNYESPTCVGDTGQTVQTQVGASLVANDFTKDHALLQMYNQPPPVYDIYYAGWDATGNQPTSQVVIHHPYYDVKKITMDYDPAGTYTNSYNTNLWSCTWEVGVVEAFSSGSPLFDQNQRVIGLMTDGSNACFNVQNEVTGCAKFSDMWNGPTPAERFKDHLDPLNTGVLVLDGFNPNTGSAFVQLNAKVNLQGPFSNVQSLMRDDLRAAGLLPVSEPYSAIGHPFVGGGGESMNTALLSVTGAQAPVDWVVVQLRNKNDATQVVYSSAVVLRRDGQLVDGSGSLPVFPVSPDDYYVSVLHRNHLPVTSGQPVALAINSSLLDFTDPSTSLHGSSTVTLIGGVALMVGGDVNNDQLVSYIGTDNDRDVILTAIGGNDPTLIVQGYLPEDCNLDGNVKYLGLENDRDFILLNIGGNAVTNVVSGGLP
jgi:hypothetical protein